MKSILVFVNPSKQFNEECEILARVQIDNSLDLGWKKEDILLLTNFDYEYNGIKSLIVRDEVYCDYSPISIKITGVLELFRLGLIKEDELYWTHDFDAFQLESITEDEVDLGTKDMGLCPLGRKPRWAGGSVFFKQSSRDIYEKIKNKMDELRTVDEMAITTLTNENEEIRNRIKLMNISYNFITLNVRSCYRDAIKPIKVAHFHPFRGVRQSSIENALEWYKGKNKINTPIITERLIKIFDYHGVI